MLGGLKINIATAGRSVQLAPYRGDMYLAATGANSQIGIHAADVDGATSGTGIHISIDIVEANRAAAGLGIHPAVEVGKLQAAAVRLGLDHFHGAGRIDVELNHAASPVSRAFAAKVGGLTLAIGNHSQVFKISAGALFRITGKALANRISNIRLL